MQSWVFATAVIWHMKQFRHWKFQSLWGGPFHCCGVCVFFKEEFDSLFKGCGAKLSAWQPRKGQLANGEAGDAQGISSMWLEAGEQARWQNTSGWGQQTAASHSNICAVSSLTAWRKRPLFTCKIYEVLKRCMFPYWEKMKLPISLKTTGESDSPPTPMPLPTPMPKHTHIHTYTHTCTHSAEI